MGSITVSRPSSRRGRSNHGGAAFASHRPPREGMREGMMGKRPLLSSRLYGVRPLDGEVGNGPPNRCAWKILCNDCKVSFSTAHDFWIHSCKKRRP